MNVNYSDLDGKRDQFQTAVPYPHIITDGLFSRKFCQRIVDDIPAKTSSSWRHHSTTTSDKWTCPLRAVKSHAHAEMEESLRSKAMIRGLQHITGIDDIFAQAAAKITRIDPGGFLHIHTDYGLTESAYRIINLLIYLNNQWKPEWECCLNLYDLDGKAIRQVIPEMARAIIFVNRKDAWHGHPERLSSPGQSRFCIQQYYLSSQSVGNESTTTYYYHSKGKLRALNNVVQC